MTGTTIWNPRVGPSGYTGGTGEYRIRPLSAASLDYGSGSEPSDLPVSFPADEEAVANHHAYLARMATEGVVPAEGSAKARRIAESARMTVPNLPVPVAVAYPGGPIHYTWDNGRFQVTAEVLAEGPCEWYVSDRQTGAFDGGDFNPADGLPAAMIDGLRRILNRPLWIAS